MVPSEQQNHQRRVAVYRSSFLPPSETFVRDHLLRMPRYTPVAIAGYRLPEPLPVPGREVLLARAESPILRLRAAIQRRTGHERSARTLALTDTLRRSRADLVHAHFGTDGAEILDASRARRLPLVVTFHGFDATSRPEELAKEPSGAWLVENWDRLLRSAAAVVTVSTFMRGILIERGADPGKLHIVPCGVDASTFTVRPLPEQTRLLFVGRMVEKKGLTDLFEALAGMEQPPALDIVGDGPLREQLERRAKELRLPVLFHGVRSTEQVREHIGAASILVMPSKTAASGDREGLPVTALEAAAGARAVVGYRSGGLGEAVEHGRTGLLTQEGDVPGLRELLRELAGDREQQERLGNAARERLIARFDLNHHLGRLADIYDGVLERHARTDTTALTV